MRTKKVIVAEKQAVHYTAPYLIDPAHPVTINVIGCGGTGSQVINSLARMNSALKALGHPGLYIRAIDPDRVTEANMGRQLFSPSDVDSHKCTALIGKVNRFFGTDWEALPMLYSQKARINKANITISCVDTGAARKEIKESILNYTAGYQGEPFKKPYYWLDFGNMQDRGQVVLGAMTSIKQPVSDNYRCVELLPTVDVLHPEIFIDNKKDDQGPSCSLAEALGKQDLFINTNLANMGLAIIWKMFRELRISYHGLYLNLDTLSMNPIPVQ